MSSRHIVSPLVNSVPGAAFTRRNTREDAQAVFDAASLAGTVRVVNPATPPPGVEDIAAHLANTADPSNSPGVAPSPASPA